MDKRISDLKCEFECKSEEDDVGTFTGVASTNDVDSDGDVIQAGAFDPIPMRKSPAGGDVPNIVMCRDHDRSQIIGGWRSLVQKGSKLLVEGELALTVEKARETYALMKRGFLSGLSVCFTVGPDPKNIGKDKQGRRVIKKATLREISIVGFPANQSARIISVKGVMDAWLTEHGFASADLERLLQQLKQNNNGNGKEPPDPNEGESRETFMKRCMRATGGDVEGCQDSWDDYEEDSEGKFLEHLRPQDKETTPEKPYGDVRYADPGYQEDGKKRYPIDTEQHIRAAWNYIHKPKNRSPYSKDELDKIEGRIIAAWKRVIDKDGPPSADEKDADPMAAVKGLMATLAKRAHS